MFSKELEDLIQATLEDGQLEDYEKAALQKRAMAEGVDITELEIYINSILQKRKKEHEQAEDAKQAEIDQKKKETLGRICPKCGKQVPPLTLKCDCGYEFTTQKQVSSVQILSEKIESCYYNDEKVRNLISMYAVPNTKEDIIEFLALSLPNSKHKGGFLGTMTNRFIAVVATTLLLPVITGFLCSGLKNDELFLVVFNVLIVSGIVTTIMALKIDLDTIRWNKMAEVWRAKFEQVLMKGRSLRGDAEFTQQLDYYENLFKRM